MGQTAHGRVLGAWQTRGQASPEVLARVQKMHSRKHLKLCACAGVLFAFTAAQAQFSFVTNNGTITITGYTGTGGNVVIPRTTNGWQVTGLGDRAFQDVTNINVVTVPDSVTNMGPGVFSGCIWLFGVNLPTNLPSIGDYAFYQCSQLTGLTVPTGVTNLGAYAFYGCASLRQLRLP